MGKMMCGVLVSLLCVGVSAHAKPPVKSQSKKPDSKSTRGAIQGHSLANGYVVEVIGRESDDGNRVRILRDGRVIKQLGRADWVSLGASCFFLPAVTRDEPLIKKPDQDVTGDGVPDVVIREYDGGMRKLVTDHVFGLSPKRLIVYKPVSYGYAEPRAKYFIKGRGKALDVELQDWSLAPLFDNMFDAPTPTVRLKFFDDGEQAEWAFANPPKKLTVAQKAELMKHAAGLAQSKKGPMGEKAYGQMVEVVASLIYTGNAETCQEYVRAAFKGRDEERMGFLIELAGVLNDSDMSARMLAMNECNTWSELLCGRKGVLRTDCGCDETGYWSQQEEADEPDVAAKADGK